MKSMGTITRTPEGGYVLRYERRLDKSAKKVWAALTDPAILINWLSRADVDLRVGGKYVLYFFDGKETMHGTIRQLVAERLLEYSWNEDASPESVVRWTITPEINSCQLTLTHTLPPGSSEELTIELGGGWHAILDNLEDGLGGKLAVFDEPKLRALEQRYRARHFRTFEPNACGQSESVLGVRFERLLPGPIERVWRHLTDTKLLPGWFGDGSIEPRLGGVVSLMGGHVRGTITQWRPPHRLTYTWNVYGPSDGLDADSAYPESYLSFTLETRGDAVLLRLTHLPVLARFEKQNAMGWHTFLDMLGAALQGGKVEDRAVYMRNNANLYGVDLTSLVR